MNITGAVSLSKARAGRRSGCLAKAVSTQRPPPFIMNWKKPKYKIVERKDHLAVHGLFDTQARAERHLREIIPVYVAKGYYMDKTLRPEDFEVIQYSI